MSTPPLKRRLVTILASDAVGYSRMMSDAEEDTMRVLAAHRSVIDGIIQFHEGRIISTAGDSVLAEFASPVQAVRCAVEIQDALKTRNDALPENRKLLFRIGINLGDVMVKGDDLLGDGVNVAARLESIAEPGGICISSSVYDQISGKLDLKLADIGEQNLKNISRPIRTYRIQSAGARPAAAPPRPARAGSGRRLGWGIAAFVVLCAAAAALWLQQERGKERAAQAEESRAEAQAAAAALRAKAQADAARAKAEVDAAHAKADADAARAKANADAARARAEAEVARAKAEANAARAKADADAVRAKAQAEADVARIRSQARADEAKLREAAKRAAAAAPAPQLAATALAVPDATRYDGDWLLTLSCPAFEGRRAREGVIRAKMSDGILSAEYGSAGQPGYFRMRGKVEGDDSLLLHGRGVSGNPQNHGKTFRIGIPGRFSDGGYRGEGKFGGRQCAVAMQR